MKRHSFKIEKLPRLLLRTKKAIYHMLKYTRPHHINILFILGCQRSGTTLLTRIFENDFNMNVYHECSVLSSQDKDTRIRLNPLDQVKRVLERSKIPGVVIKPLVESQNARELLNYFESSKGLWVFRHYKDVALSSVKKFGKQNGINNLKAIIDKAPNNWRSERVSEDTEKRVRSLYSETMDPYDAAALFWFVRNRLFYELGLHENSRVMIGKYDDLVADPVSVVKSIYGYMDCRYPGDKIIDEVHADSVGKGKHIELSPEIDSVCRELYCNMDETYRASS